MKKIVIALVCAMLILTVGCGSKNEKVKNNEPGYYTVNIKINPDVSFMVDTENKVVGIVTNNDDARDVYNNLIFSSYDLDTVAREWAVQCTVMGFNTHKMEVGICGSDEEIASFSDTWNRLKKEYEVFNAEDIHSIETQAELPTCEHCGEAYIDNATGVCPTCHLNNPTGIYEEGYGNPVQSLCFCGEGYIDNETGICPVCHLNNLTGSIEIDPNCSYCHGTGYIEQICSSCGGRRSNSSGCMFPMRRGRSGLCYTGIG